MDIKIINEILWSQFGASIEMLENAVKACPDELWTDKKQNPEFWYLSYHVLFWLDFYLTETADKFNPPKQFTLSELDPEGILPERVYSKNELLSYLEHGRIKSKQVIENLTEENANRHYKYGSVEMSFGELLLYNLRHVQHHVGQLNLILRQKTDSAPKWVKRASE